MQTDTPAIWRCDVTGNPVGTDTRMIGASCQCQGCKAVDEITRLRKELDAARKALNSSIGYMLNAKIDLETGVPKRTAIQTIEGGIKMVRATLGETSDG